jgi:hypothetical protein
MSSERNVYWGNQYFQSHTGWFIRTIGLHKWPWFQRFQTMKLSVKIFVHVGMSIERNV